MRRWMVFTGSIVVFLCALNTCSAQARKLSGVVRDDSSVSTNMGPDELKTNADYLDYDSESGWITARGHVVIEKGGQVLKAKLVRVNMKTESAFAAGDVVLTRPGQSLWTGASIRGNFKTGVWEIKDLKGGMDPFRLLESGSTERLADKRLVIQSPMLTTCKNKKGECHFHAKASRMELVPGEYLKTWDTVWYMGKVPIIYVPFWYRDLDDDTGFRFVPGYNSRMGPYLLSSYRYRMGDKYKAETHVDYRAKRGVAVGQDLKWRKRGKYYGGIKAYYANDQQPIDDDENPNDFDIDTERYRVFLKHQHNFGPRDYLMVETEYVSDTDVREDFFEKDYRKKRQPENFGVYTHRDDRYTLSLNVWARLNDFYENVNRLPELSVDFMRQEIGDSTFFYEGQTAVSYLQKVFPESDDVDVDDPDYSSGRFDTEHMIYRPARHFGFLNLIPRAGWRGTYYSATRETVTDTNVVFAVSTNVVVSGVGVTNVLVSSSTQTNETSRHIEKGGDFRALVQFGVETSFKAFKTWDNGNNRPIRHVFEPYANYTFVPEADLVSENIYQFDAVDRLGKQHYVKLGTRNKIQTKIQTKVEDMPFDLVDLDVYTIVDVDPEPDHEAVENVYADAEFRFWRELWLDADMIVDIQEGLVDSFNLEARIKPDELWSASVDYRYRNESASIFSGRVSLYPNKDWELESYTRYDLDESRLEEQGGYIWRKFDCMVFRTGGSFIPGYERSDGSVRDDEVRFTFEFWFTAFPDLGSAG